MPDSFDPTTLPSGDSGFEFVTVENGVTNTVYFNANGDVVGEAIEDPVAGIDFSETITEDVDGSGNPTGTYTVAGTENTGQVSKTYSFIYNTSDDSLVSGQETIDGIVYDYDSSGNITKSKDTSALTSDLILSGDDLLAVPEVLRADGGGDTYAITEPITGTSDSETTYYDF